MWQLHSNRLNKFTEDTKNVPKFKEELSRLKQAKIELGKKRLKISNPNVLREIGKHLVNCNDGIDKLTMKLHNIRNMIDYTDYILESIPYLNKYHAARKELQLEEQKAQLNPDHTEINMKRRYYNYFFKKLVIDYKKRFFPHLVKDLIDATFYTSHEENYNCNKCNVKYIHDRKMGELVCPSCGSVSPVRMGVEGANAKYCLHGRTNGASWKRANTYKRLNHFREYIRQRQGKSHPKIPDDIFTIIGKEIKKYYNKTPSCKDIHHYLKKFKLADYYEDVPLITKRFNPKCDVLNLSSMEEEKLCILFVQTEAPYEKHKKAIRSTRKNFMSYPYVCYKLCEMIPGMEKHMKYFPLLKTDSLVSEQDRWWEQVCGELGWEYINTVGNINLPTHEKPGVEKKGSKTVEPLRMFQTNEEFIRDMDDIDKFTVQTTIGDLKTIIDKKINPVQEPTNTTTQKVINPRKRKRNFTLKYTPCKKKRKLTIKV